MLPCYNDSELEDIAVSLDSLEGVRRCLMAAYSRRKKLLLDQHGLSHLLAEQEKYFQEMRSEQRV